MNRFLNIKNLFTIALVILAILITVVLLKTCEDVETEIESKTITVHDTTYMPSAIIKVPEYFPVIDTFYIDTLKIPKPSTDLGELTMAYKKLANEHYKSLSYRDSIKLTDSAYLGKDLGTVYIDDLVSENELKKRNIRYQLKYPVITNTITTTNTVSAKPKNQVFAGFQLTGNQTSFVNGINGIVLLKNKKDLMYGISAGGQLVNDRLHPQFGISVLKKISLK